MEQGLTQQTPAALLEKVVIGGDLKALTPAERLSYYRSTCESLGLNPLTRPFEYIVLNGKLTLYARKDATEQLRKLHNISVVKLERELTDGVYCVIAHVEQREIRENQVISVRSDSSLGAVHIEGLKGEAKANGMMKSETKAKRRATLSICGLGMLDETEIETIAEARPFVEKAVEIAERKTETDAQRQGVLEEIKLAFKSAGLDQEANKGVRFGTLQACFGTKKWTDVQNMDLNTLLDCLTVLKDWLGIKREGTAKPFVAENPDADAIPGTNSQQEAF